MKAHLDATSACEHGWLLSSEGGIQTCKSKIGDWRRTWLKFDCFFKNVNGRNLCKNQQDSILSVQAARNLCLEGVATNDFDQSEFVEFATFVEFARRWWIFDSGPSTENCPDSCVIAKLSVL